MLCQQIFESNTMKIRTNLPSRVHGITYVKNTHYIDLEDDSGHHARIDATGIVKYKCDKCKFVFWTTSNHGTMACPMCHDQDCVKPAWYKPQLSFIPEKPSDFKGNFKFEKKKTRGKS